MPDSSVLVVFFRRPAIGTGKRRIAARLDDQRTCELAGHLLAGALEDASDWPGAVVLAPADREDRQWAKGLLERDCLIVPQRGGNLGERIAAIDKQLRADGSERIFFIGSDAPLLNAGYYQAARAALDRHDVVLGPAADGGVTLMGARHAWPALAALPWSSADLGRALEQSCTEQGLTVHKLDSQRDIDTVDDLPALYAGLKNDPRPARRALRDWLSDNSLVGS